MIIIFMPKMKFHVTALGLIACATAACSVVVTNLAGDEIQEGRFVADPCNGAVIYQHVRGQVNDENLAITLLPVEETQELKESYEEITIDEGKEDLRLTLMKTQMVTL